MSDLRFEGTQDYVATPDLMLAVNAAIRLQRPLLIKGEPGTGKTLLAEQVAVALNAPMIEWHIKSTTKAQHGLYEYDAVSRLRDDSLFLRLEAERLLPPLPVGTRRQVDAEPPPLDARGERVDADGRTDLSSRHH